MAATDPLDPDVRAKLAASSVPSVVSTLFRMGFANTFMRRVRRLNAEAPTMVGPAFTMRTIPIREDARDAIASGDVPNLQARAFEETPAGAVLVCDAGGETETALLGDMIATHFLVRGVAGIVVDGSVNDRAAISALALPTYAVGDASLPFTSHRNPIELNAPIGCGGVPVMPGDVVVGDVNGVTVIPAEKAAEVAEAAYDRERLEQFAAGLLRDGAPLKGTYPPNDETRRRFEDWLRKQEPSP